MAGYGLWPTARTFLRLGDALQMDMKQGNDMALEDTAVLRTNIQRCMDTIAEEVGCLRYLTGLAIELRVHKFTEKVFVGIENGVELNLGLITRPIFLPESPAW